MTESRTNPYPYRDGPAHVWWCTDCNRLIEDDHGDNKPEVCPLPECVERREKETRLAQQRLGIETYAKNEPASL